jgi:hypothetical protein
MAICPASILISGFHGNTDPVMIFFVLLSVYLLQLNRPMTWLAGLAFGMSMNIKVLPLMFIPALFWFLPNARRRIEFFGSAAAIFVTASLPYLVQDPFFVLVRVFLYRSIYGLWGLSRLFTELGAPASLNRLYGAMGAVGLLAGVTAISFRMNRAKKKPPLFLQFGLVMFFFMALTPGFGVQYLAWLAPWVVALGPWAALLYYCTSGIFLFLVYNYWTHGLPWYLADAHQAGWWHGYIVGFELLCWMSVIFLLIMLLRQVFPKPRPA